MPGRAFLFFFSIPLTPASHSRRTPVPADRFPPVGTRIVRAGMLPAAPEASLTVGPGDGDVPSGFRHHRGMLSVEKSKKKCDAGRGARTKTLR